jgi:hypothetical protein
MSETRIGAVAGDDTSRSYPEVDREVAAIVQWSGPQEAHGLRTDKARLSARSRQLEFIQPAHVDRAARTLTAHLNGHKWAQIVVRGRYGIDCGGVSGTETRRFAGIL